jgi:DNA-directed RNA polymerase specialized sigma24 family protein
VWEAVRKLPTKQRAAVLLRFAADLPYREVARAAGGTEEAARRNVADGLRALRKEWGG